MFCSSECITTPFELFTCACFHTSCDQVSALSADCSADWPWTWAWMQSADPKVRNSGRSSKWGHGKCQRSARVSIPMHPLNVLFSCLKVRKPKFTPIQRSWPQQSSSEQCSKCYTELDEVLTRVQVNTTFLNDKSSQPGPRTPFHGKVPKFEPQLLLWISKMASAALEGQVPSKGSSEQEWSVSEWERLKILVHR